MTAICLVSYRMPVQEHSKLRPSYVQKVNALSDGGYANALKAKSITYSVVGRVIGWCKDLHRYRSTVYGKTGNWR
jgi:hypothetical protein